MAIQRKQPPYQVFPPLTIDEFKALKADIRSNGVQIPIMLDEFGHTLDGHHRQQAWQELRSEGVKLPDYPVILRTGLDEAGKRDTAYTLNAIRRHLTKEQRRKIVGSYLREYPYKSDRTIATLFGVSPSTVGVIRGTVQIGRLKVAKRVGKDGKTRKLPTARSIIAVSHSEATRAMKRLTGAEINTLPNGFVTANDVQIAVRQTARELTRNARMAKMRKPGKLTTLGTQKYAVILADPPWEFNNQLDPSRRLTNKYPTMTLEDICNLPVERISAQDGVLFLWCPAALLPEALQVVDRWGFIYKTGAVWDKDKVGMGSWFRLQHEHLLFAIRGKPPTPKPAHCPASIIRAKRGSHSAKPIEVRTMIERMYPKVPKVELFARVPATKDWDVWGNEVTTQQRIRTTG